MTFSPVGLHSFICHLSIHLHLVLVYQVAFHNLNNNNLLGHWYLLLLLDTLRFYVVYFLHILLGQLTQELYSGNMSGYGNIIDWNASNIASGIYFAKIQVGNNLESQKLLLVK